MLINATQPEEIRVALVDGQKLYDLDIESTNRTQKKSNIYKGRIVQIEPSLEAAFVDYGGNRHGFLPFKEIHLKTRSAPSQYDQVNIRDTISEGLELIVQIEKEERGNKGAALTNMISLAGRYVILMPNSSRSNGISRQIEGVERTEARSIMSQLNTPENSTLILRTAGTSKSREELQWDTDHLVMLWQAIDKASRERPAPFLIYEESDAIIRAIRDYLRTDIEQIWIDDQTIYQNSLEFMEKFMPHNLHKLKLYEEDDPLFTKYQIENQIESAFAREIGLPSGGSLIIDHCEALTSIDINSARATKGSDIEETAFSTNLEAAEEIARQLRLRDLGGLIVIDFIDMMAHKNQQKIRDRFESFLRIDRAKIQLGEISRFGLLEMSRQRLRLSLGESSHLPCPRCNGQGTIRDVESISLTILRMIEEKAMKDSTYKIIVNLPVSAATFLLNEKRSRINELRERLDVEIVIIPSVKMETPDYLIQRVRMSESNNFQYQKSSYKFIEEIKEGKRGDHAKVYNQQKIVAEQPAVKHILPQKPIDNRNKDGTGIISTIMGWLFGTAKKQEKPNKHRSRRYNQNKSNRNRRHSSSKKNSSKSDDSRYMSRNFNSNQKTRSRGNKNNASRNQNDSSRHRRKEGSRRSGYRNKGSEGQGKASEQRAEAAQISKFDPTSAPSQYKDSNDI